MQRRKLNFANSQSQFIKYAMKTQAKNLAPQLTRGGYRT